MASLTAKQLRFIDEYLVSLNGTQSAIRAGYSPKTAYSIASENLKRPEIREEINRRLAESCLTANETLKSIGDIAKASLNDYLTVKQVVHIPKVSVRLSVLIDALRAEIEDADKLVARIGPLSEEDTECHLAGQASRERQIIIYEIELERNPSATRIVDGEPEFVEVAELDMVRIARDREGGRIKSVSVTETGTKVEMYAADAALRDLAKVHGLFEKDNAQSAPKIPAVQKVLIVRPSEEEDE